MRYLWKQLAIVSPLLLASANAAQAQHAAPPPEPDTQASDAPLYNPAQLPSFTGVVQQFTLTPRGDIDGFIFADGVEVKTPPYLSTEIAYAVRVGDSVTVHGLKAEALPLIQAASVTDAASGKTVVDNGPPGPRVGPPPPTPPAGPGAAAPVGDLVQGQVRMPLHGPKGDVNGALLDSGVIVRLPPPEAARYANLLQAGQPLAARGVELRTALGSVLDAHEIGASADRLTPVQAPAERRPPPPRG